MRVALVIGRYDAFAGGAERWTDRHARYLLRRGIEVHLLSRMFRGAPEGAFCQPIDAGKGFGSRLRFAALAEEHCQRVGYDVVHDMGDGWRGDFFMPHHGTRAGGLTRNLDLASPLLRPFARLEHRFSPRFREQLELERRQYALDSPTTFVAISNMVAADMQRFYGVPSQRIRTVYNGIDVNRFSPGRNDGLRESLRWQGRTIFLLAAHNFRLKGLRQAIQALHLLRRDGAACGLLVIGKDRSGPWIRWARRLGCADSLHFAGDQEDPVPYFHAADVYLQPTFYDPCSLVLLEALACGLPVITTRFNGAAELLKNGEGLVIDDPKDAIALAHAMRSYLSPEIRGKSAAACRLLAPTLSLERNSGVLLALYEGRIRVAA